MHIVMIMSEGQLHLGIALGLFAAGLMLVGFDMYLQWLNVRRHKRPLDWRRIKDMDPVGLECAIDSAMDDNDVQFVRIAIAIRGVDVITDIQFRGLIPPAFAQLFIDSGADLTPRKERRLFIRSFYLPHEMTTHDIDRLVAVHPGLLIVRNDDQRTVLSDALNRPSVCWYAIQCLSPEAVYEYGQVLLEHMTNHTHCDDDIEPMASIIRHVAASGRNINSLHAGREDRVMRTYLHHAAAFGNTTVVRALLAAGADPTVPDAAGRLPWHVALTKADVARLKPE